MRGGDARHAARSGHVVETCALPVLEQSISLVRQRIDKYVGPSVVIVIKRVASQVGDVKVGPAVIIEVADGYTHAVSLCLQSRRLSHVGEGAVAIVAVETVPKARVGLVRLRAGRHGIAQGGAIDE